ncbi:hypothetical protein RYZ26_11175 [Terasakiella sp. A23]|uniref:hypothetical protein n=1 Tax=Terasakiella sp. FCG-A23 TaxID=3080561 RepID=UPI0029556B3B|nr:hypothetical protein [Terasakiella sp. A23]MDV7340158.1 hypothetical protein [Terasakiella sp. A23]
MEELVKWLEDQDYFICASFASRNALRILPFLSEGVSGEVETPVDTVILPVFRSLAISWYGLGASFTAVRSVNSAARRLPPPASVVVMAASAALKTSAAGDSVSITAASDIASAKASYATSRSTAIAAVDFATSLDTGIWKEILFDIKAYEENNNVDEFLLRPLWNEGMPSEYDKYWKTLKRLLLARDENWQVWTNWYEDRVVGGDSPNGRNVINDLERKRVLIPNSEWKKGALHVNGLIMELEDRYHDHEGTNPIEPFFEQKSRPYNNESIPLTIEAKRTRIIVSETYLEKCDFTFSAAFFGKNANADAFFDIDLFTKILDLEDVIKCETLEVDDIEACMFQQLQKVFQLDLSNATEEGVNEFIAKLWHEEFVIYERSPPSIISLKGLAKLAPKLVATFGGKKKSPVRAVFVFGFAIIVVYASVGIGEGLQVGLRELVIEGLNAAQSEPFENDVEQIDDLKKSSVDQQDA